MLGLLEFDPALDFKLLLAVPLIPLVGYVLQIFLRQLRDALRVDLVII